jgi:hypothetical protein
VTAELALALPALFAVLGLALWAIAAAGAAMRCEDAARAGARAAARGDSGAAVRDLVARTGPRGARMSMSTTGGLVTVTVRAPAKAPGPIPLPGFTVQASAVAQLEGAR